MNVKDLIEIVKSRSTRVKYNKADKNNDVFKFMEKFGIEAGDHRIYIDKLEALYYTYSKNQHDIRFLRKELKRKLTADNRYYYINRDNLTLSEEEINKKLIKSIFSYEKKRQSRQVQVEQDDESEEELS